MVAISLSLKKEGEGLIAVLGMRAIKKILWGWLNSLLAIFRLRIHKKSFLQRVLKILDLEKFLEFSFSLLNFYNFFCLVSFLPTMRYIV